MGSASGGFNPAYQAFHGWLAKNRGSIAAGKDQTVIYSGIDSGEVPIWKRLAEHERFFRDEYGRDPRWTTIEAVLRRIKVDWKSYGDPASLPKEMLALGTMWEFACGIGSVRNAVTGQESKQIWKNLSAWYVKNATGKAYIFEGDTLKKYPDFLLAEIPVLLRNKNVKLTEATQAKMLKLVPDSKAAWEKYRKDTPGGRLEGR